MSLERQISLGFFKTVYIIIFSETCQEGPDIYLLILAKNISYFQVKETKY